MPKKPGGTHSQGIEHAKVRLKRFAEKLRDEYRKGRDRE